MGVCQGEQCVRMSMCQGGQSGRMRNRMKNKVNIYFWIRFTLMFQPTLMNALKCTGSHIQHNVSAKVGDSPVLFCPISHCPHLSAITWLTSNTLEGPRTTTVSSDWLAGEGNPFTFTLTNVTPMESGWYWCASDNFESGLYVSINENSFHPYDSSTTVSTPNKSKQNKINSVYETSKHISTESVRQERNKITGDHSEGNILDKSEVGSKAVFNIRTEASSEEDLLPTKSELESIIWRFLQPIHRQLADIHDRLNYVEGKLSNVTVARG